ncbi:MAG: hypothetical protein HY294_05625 [Candidatus Rokubacteria bacterium]|nr:hypothetical protein [Candidatus Rokubacteria bacterium]MBI3825455.1 hypothetical protein [Candidatus Rokubacteria bacterium]
MTALWGTLAAVGAVTFLWSLAGDAPHAWSIYLVNVVFWSGLAVTGPAIAAMMQLTEARWSPSVRRIALTTAGFLPVSFVLILVLYLGRVVLYPWVTTPIPVKAPWLNTPFFWLRTFALAAALFLLSFALIRQQLAGGAAAAATGKAGRDRVSILVLMLWLITVSLWGFDLVMSLDPHWYSGLYGGYFAVSTLYTGCALLSILVVRSNARGLTSVPPAAVQDVAKLQFMSSILWMYFFWSQYLVIWYGNVPVETRFVVKRFLTQPWGALAWAVMIVGWLVPFAYLLKRLTGRPPQRHTPLVVVAAMALLAIFFERVLVVFPSVARDSGLVFSLRELLVSLGFLSLFVLARRWFLARFRPIL